MSKEEVVRLSASRIKTLQTCSWTYYCNYVLKLPQKNNSGAMRGTIAHLVFEILSNPRHHKYVKKILKKETCESVPSVWKLIFKTAKKLGLDMDETVKPLKKEGEKTNLKCIDEMIIVGLKFDFTDIKGFISSEWAFDITNESPKYRIVGFVDRMLKSPDGTLVVRDYKSSKKIFDNSELESNLQSMMYSLAIKKSHPGTYKDIVAKFLFLRFPDNPEKSSPIFSDEVLEGFEHYLEYVGEQLQNFNEEKGKTNFAKHDFGKKWMCQTKSGWKCPYLEAMEYKALVDKDGKLIKCIFNSETFNKEDMKEGYSVQVRNYEGCPAWKKKEMKDAFDF
jgi:ATP-dependent helicase/DNAse subunit B